MGKRSALVEQDLHTHFSRGIAFLCLRPLSLPSLLYYKMISVDGCIFPLLGDTGRADGAGGGDLPLEVCSSETPIFPKERSLGLFHMLRFSPLVELGLALPLSSVGECCGVHRGQAPKSVGTFPQAEVSVIPCSYARLSICNLH